MRKTREEVQFGKDLGFSREERRIIFDAIVKVASEEDMSAKGVFDDINLASSEEALKEALSENTLLEEVRDAVAFGKAEAEEARMASREYDIAYGLTGCPHCGDGGCIQCEPHRFIR